MKLRLVLLSVALTTILFSMVAGIVCAENEALKYVNYQCDLFSVKFQKPDGWKEEVTSDYVLFTNPKNKNVQLSLLEGEPFDGGLDSYYENYKKFIKDETKAEPSNKKPLEVAGYGAIYVRVNTEKKDRGHIIFLKDKTPYILVLKTDKGQYGNYEPVLLKMAETLRFYKPSVMEK